MASAKEFKSALLQNFAEVLADLDFTVSPEEQVGVEEAWRASLMENGIC